MSLPTSSERSLPATLVTAGEAVEISSELSWVSELVIEDASGDLRPVEPDPTKFVRIEARGLRSTSVHGSPSLEVHGDARGAPSSRTLRRPASTCISTPPGQSPCSRFVGAHRLAIASLHGACGRGSICSLAPSCSSTRLEADEGADGGAEAAAASRLRAYDRRGAPTADAESGEVGDYADVRYSNIKSLALGESVRAVEHQEASLAAAPRIAG